MALFLVTHNFHITQQVWRCESRSKSRFVSAFFHTCAFYDCLLAKYVPVDVQCPLHSHICVVFIRPPSCTLYLHCQVLSCTQENESQLACRESAICSDLCKTVNPGLGLLPLAPLAHCTVINNRSVPSFHQFTNYEVHTVS